MTTGVTSTLWASFRICIMDSLMSTFPRLDLENVCKVWEHVRSTFRRIVGITIIIIALLLLLLLKRTLSLRNSAACFHINCRKVLSTWAVKLLWSRHFWERSLDSSYGLIFCKGCQECQGRVIQPLLHSPTVRFNTSICINSNRGICRVFFSADFTAVARWSPFV